MAYYGVKVGKTVGIYSNWDEAKKQVVGFKGAIYKKFNTEKEARQFVYEGAENKTKDIELKDLKDGEWSIYVDGSYMDGKPSPVGYGCVFLDNKGEKYMLAGGSNDPTLMKVRNVAGEVMASLYSMWLAVYNGKTKVYIHHDYQGVASWITGEWEANTEVSKNYVDYYNNNIRDKVEIEFIKVEAHTGNEYNELADTLAKAGTSGDYGVYSLITNLP